MTSVTRRLAVIAVLLLGLALPGMASAQAKAWLSIEQPSAATTPGGSFSTPLVLASTGGAVGALDVLVQYDPSVLTLLSFTADTSSGFFPEGYTQLVGLGAARLVAFQLTRTTPTNGRVPVGTLQWKAVGGAGAVTAISLAANTVVESNWNPIDVTASGLRVVVNAAVQARVQTKPIGRSFSVDGSQYVSGQSFSWSTGSEHWVCTDASQRGGAGTSYLFTGWSDGGQVCHTLTTGGIDAVFTAAFGVAFLDDPSQPKVTQVKAAHILDLRQAIGDLRAWYGLPGMTWTDATLTPGMPTAKAVHLTELRAALAEVYATAGRTLPPFAEPSIVGRETIITAAQIAELRAAVKAIW